MVFLTLEQAEEFFKQYGGHKFHMDREDHYKMQLYRRLNVPEELEDEWRRDLNEQREM